MNKQIRFKTQWLFLLFAGLLITLCVSCDNSKRKYPILGGNQDSGDYLIDPYTILISLDQGNTDVFLPILATPSSVDELLPAGSFAWTQSDYLKIANAFSLYVWNDPMEDWSIYSLNFKRDCQNIDGGFDSFIAIYYKEVRIGLENRYKTRQIDIFPLAKQVTWGSGSDYPRSVWDKWATVDVQSFKITADEAFQIAEKNGGTEARLKVRNKCNILVKSPHNKAQKWSVSYYVLAAFQVIIDPYTGQYETFTQ